METVPLTGSGVDRVDGPLKVAGAAHYPSDFSFPNLAYAVLVGSTVAAGRISSIDTALAEAAPGVLTVITHTNAPRLRRGPSTLLGPTPPPPLQHDRVLHYGQYVAVVVAETAEQATAAARLVQVTYEETKAVLHLDDPEAKSRKNPLLQTKRGDAVHGLASAEVTVEETYTTPDETNNPLGLFSTVAFWEGNSLTVHDTTQYPYNVRDVLARTFRVPKERVRVLAPFVGGGFGAGLRTWPHVILAALAARTVNRPVKLVLTRPQMFTAVGHRPNSVQQIKIGASRDGKLVAIKHAATSPTAIEDAILYPITMGTSAAYACPHVATSDTQVRLNIPCPGFMRAPGECEGNFALESALDELSYRLGIDPLELRLRNYAEVHPQTGLPWSSKALRECYEVGAERFGWSHRNPEPRSMRDGRWLVGYGMAGVSFSHYQARCKARASLRADGTAYVRSAATDIGTGTYTVMTQVAAEVLGLDVSHVQFDLGDSNMPLSPQAGGSGLTGALGSAVHNACVNLVRRILDLAQKDAGSPLQGLGIEDMVVRDGRICRADDPARGEAYTDILARHKLDELTSDGESAPSRSEMGVMIGSVAVSRLGRFGSAVVRSTHATVPAGPFGAKFVEVRIDPDLGLIRVARVVSAIDGGRILNEKLATSQIIGGTVGGIGMALLEETLTDARTGRIANATFGDYLVAVNADVPDMEVLFVGEPDPMTPIGTKGIGEIGLVGIAAAIANAVYHATGIRIRELPITLEKLLA
jgi:xanthine dehydrogenase YagR molybdenum-binding subunit